MATVGSILRKLPFLTYLVAVGFVAYLHLVLDPGGYFSTAGTIVAAMPWSYLLLSFALNQHISEAANYAILWGSIALNLAVLAYVGWKKANRL